MARNLLATATETAKHSPSFLHFIAFLTSFELLRPILSIYVLIVHILCLYGHHMTYSKGKHQPGKVASPARGQLNSRENEQFPVLVRA